jgi:hypothetical protein
LRKSSSSPGKRNKLVQEFPVLTEKSGEFVANFKFTVLILPGGVKKITGLPFSAGNEAMPEMDTSKG